jgi:ABC-type transporter lipoprotein component MlaA
MSVALDEQVSTPVHTRLGRSHDSKLEDPYEAFNRKMYACNTTADRSQIRPRLNQALQGVNDIDELLEQRQYELTLKKGGGSDRDQ